VTPRAVPAKAGRIGIKDHNEVRLKMFMSRGRSTDPVIRALTVLYQKITAGNEGGRLPRAPK